MECFTFKKNKIKYIYIVMFIIVSVTFISSNKNVFLCFVCLFVFLNMVLVLGLVNYNNPGWELR